MKRAALFVALATALSFLPAAAGADTGLRVVDRVMRVARARTVRLPFAADHVALYWVGHRDARVLVAFADGRLVDAGRDEPGANDHGRTFGAIIVAPRATRLRIVSNQPIAKLHVLAIADPLKVKIKHVLHKAPAPAPAPTVGHAARPPILSRAQWGADESLRYSNGKESWPPVFEPVHKLILHHTDTANNDPNPASTVRAIYYFHAITRGWGDIGYNFLIDASGRIYKGRNSHGADGNDTITGEDTRGYGVIGAHAKGYNAGSVGVSLLGTLDTQDATPAQKNALEDLLAWEADAHGIDPHGAAVYTSPIDGHQRTFPNIAGHRDVGDTDCPGGVFYASLPAVRDAVAARM